MDQSSEEGSVSKSRNSKYLWPTPVGILLYSVAVVAAKWFGYEVFLAVHLPLEVGMVVAAGASVLYSIRLLGRERGQAPRWILIVNLMFGPLLISLLLIVAAISVFRS